MPRPRIRCHLLSVAMLALVLPALAGCAQSWRSKVDKQLPLLGHRNWIVIADSAYPWQTSPGITTVYTGEKQLDVVKAVLAAVDKADHVKPIVYVDAELAAVDEKFAPGVSHYRKNLDALLEGRTVKKLAHEQIIAQLDEAGDTFRVLLLKTDLTLPYTSVFLELDCAYWSAEAEGALRKALGEAEAAPKP